MEPMSEEGGSLIISDGGLAGLVGATIASQESAPGTIWLAPAGDDNDDARTNAVAVQASVLDLGVTHDDPSHPGDETTMLLSAARAALGAGLDRVIWAIHLGGHDPDAWPDLDELATRMDKALLCGRLASLEASTQIGVSIETPLIDLTDRQLADLAADLAAPIETCWWWSIGTAGLGPAGVEHDRFKPLLEQVGLTVEPA